MASSSSSSSSLRHDKLRKQQVNEIANARDLLSVPSAAAALLLQHCHWSIEQLQRDWFADDDLDKQVAICNELDLPWPLAGISEPKELPNSKRKCTACPASSNNARGRRTMRSAGCSHYYCDACWLRHIRAAVSSGAEECLSMRCPDPSCRVPVGWELVSKVADGEDKEMYEVYAVQSYAQ